MIYKVKFWPSPLDSLLKLKDSLFPSALNQVLLISKQTGKNLADLLMPKQKNLNLLKIKNRYRSCFRKEYQNQRLQNYSALSERLYTDIYSDCQHKPKSHLNNPRQANFLFACNYQSKWNTAVMVRFIAKWELSSSST